MSSKLTQELLGSLLQGNQNAQRNCIHLSWCFIRLPEVVDGAGLNYTLPFTGAC